jgi:hypothetical protein
MQQNERSPVSRVRENRKHGSEGDLPVIPLAIQAGVK